MNQHITLARKATKVGTVLAILFACLGVTLTAFALDHLYPAKIEKVIDADTVIADIELGLGVVLNDQTIRFYGINAWETYGEEKPKGLLAKNYVQKRLQETERIVIEVRPEWGHNGKGKYGRWLGMVFVDGVNLNRELLDRGHAELYPGEPLDEYLPAEPTEEQGIPEQEEEAVSPFTVVAVCFNGNPGGKDEWVVIQNTSDRTYNLKGWHIADYPDHGHEFEITEAIELASGEILAVTNTEQSKVTVGHDKVYCLHYNNYWWTNKEDMIRLINSWGNTVLAQTIGNTSDLRKCH